MRSLVALGAYLGLALGLTACGRLSFDSAPLEGDAASDRGTIEVQLQYDLVALAYGPVVGAEVLVTDADGLHRAFTDASGRATVAVNGLARVDTSFVENPELTAVFSILDVPPGSVLQLGARERTGDRSMSLSVPASGALGAQYSAHAPHRCGGGEGALSTGDVSMVPLSLATACNGAVVPVSVLADDGAIVSRLEASVPLTADGMATLVGTWVPLSPVTPTIINLAASPAQLLLTPVRAEPATSSLLRMGPDTEVTDAGTSVVVEILAGGAELVQLVVQGPGVEPFQSTSVATLPLTETVIDASSMLPFIESVSVAGETIRWEVPTSLASTTTVDMLSMSGEEGMQILRTLVLPAAAREVALWTPPGLPVSAPTASFVLVSTWGGASYAEHVRIAGAELSVPFLSAPPGYPVAVATLQQPP